MSIFRRNEPLHVRLAREGGMLDEGVLTRPSWDNAGIHGLQRAREWDAVTTVDVPELTGDRAEFVALMGNELVVEQGPSPQDVQPLADALGRTLEPPYRAEAVRRAGTVWAVAGRRIELVEVPGIEGDELELTSHQGERTLLVDGERSFGTIPALEHAEHSVRARRISGDTWEVETNRL